jgi:LemA protein
MTGIIVLAIIAAVLFFAVAIYNRIVALRNRYKNAFAQIDVQLQRRHDLIPNLVETAKKYMEHERETLTQVIAARNQAMAAKREATEHPADGNAMNNLGQAEGLLTGVLSRFMAVAENYPELKANETMSQLMEELTSTENRIGFARQAYNDSVMAYNTYREQFPNNIVAGTFGSFEPAHLLRLEDPEAKKSVKVAF